MKRLFRRIATVLTAIFLCVLLSGPAWAQLEPRIQVLIDGAAICLSGLLTVTNCLC
ncbi:MAG: hypothetical protein BWY80_01127 [Firmicutes bacterium ADurb.Bin456]|nr:MAG: hypothetical protein BWY80_01127 [Firmicutes bacterium ADurb.Bin456]